MAIIEVDHVTKEYRLGRLLGLRLGLQHGLARLRGENVESPRPFKALDDVSFSVEAGEVLGVIGHNGAGKSTLLKLLSRITVSTSGRVVVRGRVAPLIEIGAGLAGDMTGRENIYLNGAILGMRRAQIRRQLDDIVAFAELERFIDTPVKRYSSGMQVRLGFSIATSVNTDILVVDEVLAVGDLAFQRKCFDRMQSMIRSKGMTVLVVGHDLRQLERFCRRIILLDHGRLIHDGAPAECCKQYIEMSNQRSREYVAGSRTQNDQIMRSGEIDVDQVEVYGGISQSPAREVAIGEPMRIGIRFRAHREIDAPEVVVGFHTPDFVYIASASTATPGISYPISPGTHYLECAIDSLNLLPGVYAVRLSFLDRHSRPVWYGENLRFFSVTSGNVAPSRLPVLGFVSLDVRWASRTGDGGTLHPLTAGPAQQSPRFAKIGP